MWYEIDVMVDGALEETRILIDPEDLFSSVQSIRDELIDDGQGTDWSISVLEHFCEPSSSDCVCAQYSLDHHPVFTSRKDGELT